MMNPKEWRPWDMMSEDEREAAFKMLKVFQNIIRLTLLTLGIATKCDICKRRRSERPESQTAGIHFSHQWLGR
jgi:hypothetical protein